MITRREAIRFAAGTAGALFAPAVRRASAQGPQTGMGVGTACYGLRSRAEQASGGKQPFAETLNFLEYCHGLGAGGVQVGLSSLETGYARKVRRRAEALGMYVEVSASLPRDATELPRFQQTVRAAKQAGATVIRSVMLSGRRYESFDSGESFEQFAVQSWKSLATAEPVLRKQRMKLALENHKDWRVDEMLAMLKRLSSEFVGVCVDTGNNIALLEDPLAVVRAFAPHAYSVHLKDMAVEAYDQGFYLAEVPFGEGFLDLPKIVQVLRQAQPGARFNLEMITRDPLRIPCLTEGYWPTFDSLPGRDLARTLVMVREKQSGQPLPRISHLSPEEQIKLEDDNVRQCLAYANEHLNL